MALVGFIVGAIVERHRFLATKLRESSLCKLLESGKLALQALAKPDVAKTPLRNPAAQASTDG